MSAAGDKHEREKGNKRAKAATARRGRAAASGGVEWNAFNWWAFIALTETLSRHGGAVRLGKTRDGGAWAVGIYLGDDYATEYIRPSEDVEQAFYEIMEAWLPEALEDYTVRYNLLNGG